jgi:hypothetical protein
MTERENRPNFNPAQPHEFRGFLPVRSGVEERNSRHSIILTYF